MTLAGRAVAMLWMLVGLAVSAALTAAVVAMVGLGRRPPEGSPLREPVNAAVLRRLANESGWELIERYLPEE